MKPSSVFCLFLDYIIQTYTPAFFHPLKTVSQVHRELLLVVVFQNIKPSHDRTFVISRPTTNELAVRFFCKVERVPVFSIPIVVFAGLENANDNTNNWSENKLTGWTS